MAAKTWIGNDSGNEGDMNVAANWSPSGVPVAADDVYFTGAAVYAPTVNRDALTAVNLASVNVHPEYDATADSTSATVSTLGVDATPIEFGNVTTMRFRGGATLTECHFQAATVTTLQVLGGASLAAMLKLSGGSLSITTMDVTEAAGTTTISAGDVGDLSMFDCPSTCLVDVDVSVTGSVLADSGRLELATVSAIDELRAYGSAVATVESGAGTVPAAATLHASDAATINYDSDGDVDGMSEVWGGGTIDCRQNQSTSDVTFATVNAYNGGTFDKRNGLGTIKVTSENDFGGVILPEI